MVIAPKFNYMSIMIPVTIFDPFKQYNHLIREFSWSEKQPKIIPNQFYLKI